MNLTKATQNMQRKHSQELHYESNAIDSQVPCPNNKRLLDGRLLTERPPHSSSQDSNRENQENPTRGHAATPSKSINAIMTLLKRGQLANIGVQAYEAPQPHHTPRSQIHKQVIVQAH